MVLFFGLPFEPKNWLRTEIGHSRFVARFSLGVIHWRFRGGELKETEFYARQTLIALETPSNGNRPHSSVSIYCDLTKSAAFPGAIFCSRLDLFRPNNFELGFPSSKSAYNRDSFRAARGFISRMTADRGISRVGEDHGVPMPTRISFALWQLFCLGRAPRPGVPMLSELLPK